MTAHPIDTEALRDAVSAHEPDDHGPGKCGKDDCFTSCAECGEGWPCLVSQIPDALASAEHRATRAEAQSAIRGRAVTIYQQRAREAEAERDVAEAFVSAVKELVSDDDRRRIGEYLTRRRALEG